MQPIGLIFKDVHPHPYTGNISGELMLVHYCLGCGRISSNRLAGDDIPHVVTSLITDPPILTPVITGKLTGSGLALLTTANLPEVLTCLYGYAVLDHTQTT